MKLRFAAALALATLACLPGLGAQDKGKTEAAKLASEAQASLRQLNASVPLAAQLTKAAVAILVFPTITKAGLGIGGQVRRRHPVEEGLGGGLLQDHRRLIRSAGRWPEIRLRDVLLDAKALEQLDNANGFEVGVGPSIVVVDEGMGKSKTTTTRKDDIYAFIFGQKGLMAGMGIQGNKITKITPK